MTGFGNRLRQPAGGPPRPARPLVPPRASKARGLERDTQRWRRTLERVGDPDSAAVFAPASIIAMRSLTSRPELRWFDKILPRPWLQFPEETFRERVRRYFKGTVKPPFNHEGARGRRRVFPRAYYEPLPPGRRSASSWMIRASLRLAPRGSWAKIDDCRG